jgi:hypothetical protein
MPADLYWPEFIGVAHDGVALVYESRKTDRERVKGTKTGAAFWCNFSPTFSPKRRKDRQYSANQCGLSR